jgi:hypothetical protein
MNQDLIRVFLTFNGDGTINIGGNLGTAGTFTAGTGTVNFNSSGAQAIAPFAYTFNNLILSGSGEKTTTNAIINGILSMEGTATTTGTVATYGAAATLQYKQTTGIEFPATWSGSGGVIINNANGVNLNASKTVNYTLTLASGVVNTGSNTLTITSNGSVSGGSSSRYVNGKLQWTLPSTGSPTITFDIGDATNYTPVQIDFNILSAAGTLIASTTPGPHPNIATSGINSAKDVNRYWTLTNSGVILSSSNVIFTFVPDDVIGGANTNEFVIRKYTSGWDATVTGIKTATSTQAIGLTTFSDFAIGEQQLDHFAFSVSNPQTNGVAFTDTNTLTAQDIGNNTITAFNAFTHNVTITANSPLTGTVSGLSGGNKLKDAGDFISGVADLTSLGMKYTGNAATGTFTATSSSGKTGDSGSVTIKIAAPMFVSAYTDISGNIITITF